MVNRQWKKENATPELCFRNGIRAQKGEPRMTKFPTPPKSLKGRGTVLFSKLLFPVLALVLFAFGYWWFDVPRKQVAEEFLKERPTAEIVYMYRAGKDGDIVTVKIVYRKRGGAQKATAKRRYLHKGWRNYHMGGSVSVVDPLMQAEPETSLWTSESSTTRVLLVN